MLGSSAGKAAGGGGVRRQAWSTGVGWLTALSIAAVVAIDVFGIAGIAMSRQSVLEEAARDLRLETAARAKAMESLLASTRADLAFLTGSPVLFGLETALVSRDPAEARWRRLDAEGAVLLFLRGHPEVTHLAARHPEGRTLVEAGRRGGVPVLWVSGLQPVAPAEPAPMAARPISGRFGFSVGVRRVRGSVDLEATLDPSKLLSPDAAKECTLADQDGALLAGKQGPSTGGEDSPAWIDAFSRVETEGWSAPAPWTLRCARQRAAAVALVEPFASRYRRTLTLNLAVMSLALLLGAFAIQQARRRQRLEARAREEMRVRDLERQLFHAERLGTVGRLAAGIAHEINNPLEGMANYLDLARQALGRGDVEESGRRLEKAHQGLHRASEVVRQVLAHADTAAAPDDAVDLGSALAETVEFVRSRPEFEPVHLQLEVPDVPLTVRGSRVLLGQVFLNLLVNACEAQPGGGEVSVTAHRREDRVEVEFADRGPGVPAAQSERIFEPFYTTKNSTGLGLSICYSIVARHGGEMVVEARPGGGATFRMRFPAVESGPVDAPTGGRTARTEEVV